MPTSTPTGIAPSSDGSPSPAAAGGPTGASGSSRSGGSSGSLATRASCAPDEMSLNEVRRQRWSSERSKRAADSSAGSRRWPLHATGRPSAERSTAMQPGASSRSASKRAHAASSLGVSRAVGGTVPSASRANSSRPSAESRLFHAAAHHTTAWCCARVSAT